MELKQYAQIIYKRWWLIAVCVIIATLTTTYYAKKNEVNIYQASTKLIVNTTVSQAGQEKLDLGAMTLNARLIDTYKEIIGTTAIMDKVVTKYPDLGLTSDQLIRSVYIQSVNNSQVMTLVMRDTDYQRAAKTVNAVSEVFKAEIPTIMKIDNVTILDRASLSDTPSPMPNSTKTSIMISFAVSLLFAIGLCFLIEFLDDTLKSEESVQQVFQVPVLATVAKARVKDLSKIHSASRKVGKNIDVTT